MSASSGRDAFQNTSAPPRNKEIRAWHVDAVYRIEKAKSYPDRFPSNDDSIGIELVGATINATPDSDFEIVTNDQNASLSWLIGELRALLKVPLMEVFRHPDVSYKNPNEAKTARW